MRLFTAIDLPTDVVANLKQLLDKLRPAARINWSPPENLHITTKFIGEWKDERLGELQAALSALESRAEIPVHIRKVGFFPNPHSPRVFWCGIEAPGLDQLAAATDRATASLGIASETRPFSPHLTLARIKEPVPLQALLRAVAALPSTEFGAFAADRFHLYQSRLNPGGSVYTKLSDFPFRK